MVKRKPSRKRPARIIWAHQRHSKVSHNFIHKGAISVEFRRPNLMPAATRSNGRHLQFRWADAISSPEWTIYRDAIEAVRKSHIPFLLGGGFALAAFTGCWRDTKDIDFYIHPRDKKIAIAALKRAGFSDYYTHKKYDRRWIYRSIRANVIVDIIWSMANRRAKVDDLWFRHASSISIRGEKLLVVPIEEFIWCKLYILQRDHCDWTDILNVLYSRATRLNWARLLERLHNDIPLLKAILLVYSWLCPGRTCELPMQLWQKLGLNSPPRSVVGLRRDRVRYLDSRAWFAGLQQKSKKLQL